MPKKTSPDHQAVLTQGSVPMKYLPELVRGEVAAVMGFSLVWFGVCAVLQDMKHSVLIVVMSCLLIRSSSAETLILQAGYTETNSITIATNEAVVIDYLDAQEGRAIYRGGSVTNTVWIRNGSAFAGPCEVTFESPGNAIVTFHRIHSPAVKTVVLAANETNTVTVSSNQILKFFPCFSTPGGGVMAKISRGAMTTTLAVSEGTQPFEFGAELNGPLTVELIGSSYLSDEPPLPDYRNFFTYYLNEDFLQVTANGYLQGPPGSYEVLVEKSNNLTNWSPVMVQATATAETRAFYRLRIQK
jgi:hypothetical protein